MYSCARSDPDSAAQNFVKMSHSQKWSTYENLLGISHAVMVSIICLIGTFSCDQQGTYVTSDYCMNTPNIWLYRSLIFFSAYCLVDGCLCIFMIKNHGANMEVYFHHILGIAGSSVGIIGGGYLTVTASVSLVTEFSTPFVNIRALLYDHQIKTGSVYILNGLTMTLMFFLCRVLF